MSGLEPRILGKDRIERRRGDIPDEYRIRRFFVAGGIATVCVRALKKISVGK